MDENKEVRVEGFFEARCRELETEVKALEWNNAELVTKNEQLFERVNRLATRHPQWPAGYRPRKHSDKDPRVSK
jgi:hypothetical protein